MVMTTCIRCGKLRIMGKTWSEDVGFSQVTYTLTVCPDADCQKLVDALLKDRHDTYVARNEASLQRREENRRKSVELRKLKLAPLGGSHKVKQIVKH